jgi:glycerol uptake facilitator-like aquaporin
MILTAWFISVIMSAKYMNGANDLFLNALVIGITLFTCINIGGEISGGCFNPAVAIA